MNIGTFLTADSLYGGSQYESMVEAALGCEHKVTRHDARPWIRRGHRPQSFIRTALAERNPAVDLWIRNEIALTCMTGRRNKAQVGIVHHLDDTVGPCGPWNRALHRRLLENCRRCDRVVVVSKFWQERLAEFGVRNTTLIYNAFDVGQFAVQGEEVAAFKERHGLLGKPVLYIGNCREEKGAPAVWRALRDKPYHLVTSGLGDIDLPVRKFLLPYKDYILLLAASDAVVAMSSFEEGWNRTAHEALLCGTPVVGSGSGGMAELLQEAGQQICRDVKDLPDMAAHAVTHRAEYGRAGWAFASSFNMARFTREWLDLVADL